MKLVQAKEKIDKNFRKVKFYTRQGFRELLPVIFQIRKSKKDIDDFKRMSGQDQEAILKRVNYYNKIADGFTLNNAGGISGNFRRQGSWAYHLDFNEVLSSFPEGLGFDHVFGDNKQVPERPAFVKSRPLVSDNGNAVLLKLNSVRHYYFLRDNIPYDNKEAKLVWRGACHQSHRKSFIEAFHSHPLCDVGDVRKGSIGKPWYKDFLSVREQLGYKFVLSIEGNDVATNLKWIMASNSLCFMVRPKFETWFMEGCLIPGYHYVELKSDYSDLEEKVSYYMRHPDEAKEIISNANDHFSEFLDARRERIISHLVMKKYFQMSGQIESSA